MNSSNFLLSEQVSIVALARHPNNSDVILSVSAHGLCIVCDITSNSAFRESGQHCSCRL